MSYIAALNYVLGFMAGYNEFGYQYTNPQGIFANYPNSTSVSDYIDKFCLTNTTLTPSDAATFLISANNENPLEYSPPYSGTIFNPLENKLYVYGIAVWNPGISPDTFNTTYKAVLSTKDGKNFVLESVNN